MTNVEANLSCFRRSSSSRAIALRISPISAKPRVGFDRLPQEQQMGEASSEDFGRKVGSTLTTQWTLRNDPGIRHGTHRRRDILTAFLAADGEVALPEVEHERQYRRIKGENSNLPPVNPSV